MRSSVKNHIWGLLGGLAARGKGVFKIQRQRKYTRKQKSGVNVLLQRPWVRLTFSELGFCCGWCRNDGHPGIMMRQISMQEVLVGGALRVYTGGRKRKEAGLGSGRWQVATPCHQMLQPNFRGWDDPSESSCIEGEGSSYTLTVSSQALEGDVSLGQCPLWWRRSL